MKTIKLLALALALLPLQAVQAQTADEIISNYLENTGGEDNWKAVKNIKFVGSINFGNMQLPIEMYQTANGKTLTKADVQGQDFYQEVFDGETLWGTNQMTMAAEKSDAEATANYKLNMNDFPDSFVDYKSKNYTVELLGKETIDGTETFKIKLVKEPMTIDGASVEDISFYYFETENFVPIVLEEELTSGPGKGMVMQIKFSDYQEAGGLYFPFSISQGVKDQPGSSSINITDIKTNIELDETMFAFPAEK